MDIVANWLALLPELPTHDEFNRPWELHRRAGMTPAQARYFAAVKAGKEPPPPIQSAPILFKNGVLTDTHLYVCLENGKLARRAIATLGNIGEVFQLALTHHLAAIWIFPGTDLSAKSGEAFNKVSGWELVRPTYGETKNRPTMYIGGYKKREERAQGESGDTVYVSYPEHNSAWGLKPTSPGELLFTLAYVEDALGFQVQYSPGACGRRVIAETNKKRERAAWLAPVDMRPFPVCCAENVVDLAWKREMFPEESAQPWLLAYDKNSQYASACTGARLGTGAPEEIHAPITFDLNKLVAGIWHCSISGESVFNGELLPSPTGNGTKLIREGYYWSYTVKLLIELGYTVEIDRAWIWRESHTILRPFAEKLWESRAALDDCERYPVEQARTAARSIVKDCMNHSIGTLNSRKYLKEGSKWFRPDWRELLRDNAKYQMFMRIRKNHEEGYKLIGAHVDCLFYTSPEKDHARAIPDWIEKKRGLGGYKPKFETDIPLDVAAPLFNDPTRTIEQINSLLDAYCTEEN